MKSLVIVASTLGRDGTSRFISYLANNLTKHGDIKVKIIFFRDIPEDRVALLDEGVNVKCLNIKGKLWMSAFQSISAIIRERPTYCLFGFHQLLWLSLLKPLFHLYGIKIFLRDTIIPTLFHAGEGFLRNSINKIAYRRYDRIITQSVDMRDDLVNNWGCDINKMILVNNPVDIEEVRSKVGECPDELKGKDAYTFVAAGRLAHQKGYDIIINRMAELHPSVNFKLLVLGSGELETELRAMALNKGVSDKIQFLGYRNNVASYIYHSDALLLCSRYEGFPNIVLEAQALGKPVFSNTCKGGINEIIKNNINGIACNFEDNTDFSNGLNEFMNARFDTDEIIRLTESRYGINTIINKYITIFS